VNGAGVFFFIVILFAFFGGTWAGIDAVRDFVAGIVGRVRGARAVRKGRDA
jgi:hypothetical protein